MKINQLDTAYERNELCQKIEPLLNYDENCNSALIIINVWHTRQISANHGYDVSQEILSLIASELDKKSKAVQAATLKTLMGPQSKTILIAIKKITKSLEAVFIVKHNVLHGRSDPLYSTALLRSLEGIEFR